MSKSYEAVPASSKAWIRLAMIHPNAQETQLQDEQPNVLDRMLPVCS